MKQLLRRLEQLTVSQVRPDPNAFDMRVHESDIDVSAVPIRVQR
jgi:hypothetical protein